MTSMIPNQRYDRSEWARLRTMRFLGDYMGQTLTDGTIIGVLPADDYSGEGLYVVDQLGSPEVRRAEKIIGQPVIRLSADNPVYTAVTIGLVDFREILLGRVVAKLEILDPLGLGL